VVKGVSTAKAFIRITDYWFATPKFNRSCVVPDNDSIASNHIGRHRQAAQNVAFLLDCLQIIENFISIGRKFHLRIQSA